MTEHVRPLVYAICSAFPRDQAFTFILSFLFRLPAKQGKRRRLIWKPFANINEFVLTNPLRSITVISGIILNTYMGHTVFLKLLFCGIWQNLWRDYFLCNDLCSFQKSLFYSQYRAKWPFLLWIVEEESKLLKDCMKVSAKREARKAGY